MKERLKTTQHILLWWLTLNPSFFFFLYFSFHRHKFHLSAFISRSPSPSVSLLSDLSSPSPSPPPCAWPSFSRSLSLSLSLSSRSLSPTPFPSPCVTTGELPTRDDRPPREMAAVTQICSGGLWSRPANQRRRPPPCAPHGSSREASILAIHSGDPAVDEQRSFTWRWAVLVWAWY